MRKCSSCGKAESETRFPKNRFGKCCGCFSEYDKEHYAANRQRILETNRLYYETHKAEIFAAAKARRKKDPSMTRASNSKWRKKNPDKTHVHRILNRAIAKGIILRAERCEKCGKTGRVDAHHPDYSQPLAVKWLCRACHATI